LFFVSLPLKGPGPVNCYNWKPARITHGLP
jgi:hypothetical protein